MQIDVKHFTVKIAEDNAERDAALRLRYRVFVEEKGATPAPGAEGLEQDEFDPHCGHLILLDRNRAPDDRVIGTYRMLAGQAARRGPGFYSAGEFDLTALEARLGECLEVGRTCVAPEYRGGPATQLLWAGLARHVFQADIGVLFGCASLPGTDPAALAQPLSYLHHHHLAPPDLRARALGHGRAEMNILVPAEVNRTAAMGAMPSLVKGYLRLGGYVGDGAFVDRAFGVTDVFLAVDVRRASEERRAFFRDRITDVLARLVT